ncbi:MAG: hypothetical protein J0J01_19345 [Reyranella sp.]|uniref:hypothetical protein n=1 Tax=Reyranella sp. TaxID=1929291 RepID=UPI001AC91114|nr:hypothetical protein [Reyranella sp.]MBN9089069.1 hypothetical protein [Reyranella sp.]
MSDYDPNRTTVVTSNGGLYFVVGMLVVAVLIGAYILMGTPGLHTQVANAPAGGGQNVDITVQQPANPAPATPAAPARPERATPR